MSLSDFGHSKALGRIGKRKTRLITIDLFEIGEPRKWRTLGERGDAISPNVSGSLLLEINRYQQSFLAQTINNFVVKNLTKCPLLSSTVENC